MQDFTLQAFAPHPGYQIQAKFQKKGPVLSLEYRVSGQIADILWPAPLPPSAQQRVRGLWEHTCFEMFLKPEGGQTYWEFNFSPSGHWNCFHFTDYRHGMRDYPDVQVTQGPALREKKLWSQSWEARFGTDPMPNITEARLNLTAVIEENKEGALGFWALGHPSAKPDFHDASTYSKLRI